jgi:GntR family transcriptional regulator
MSDLDTRAGGAAGRPAADGQGAGVWLRKQRLAHGWSKAEMVRRMHAALSVSSGRIPGVSSIVRSLGGWERGERYPRDRWLAVLCQVLGVKLEDFPAAPGPAALPATLGDLDADDPRPWVQVALMLVARIDAGRLNSGDPMPRPADVAGQAGVSVPTARKAYRYLRALDVIRYWPGAGYYVGAKRPGGQRQDSADVTTRTETEEASMPDPSGISAINLHKAEASMPHRSAGDHAVAARLLMAALKDPAAGLSDEQADALVQLAVEIAQGNPVSITVLEIADVVLSARWSDGPPPGYLAVTGLDEVSWRELAARRAWLLAWLAAAEPGSDHRGNRAAALALAAVLPELDARASSYAADPDSPRWCTCGFHCRGLAALDDHLDQFPDDDAHLEVTGAFHDSCPGAPCLQE